jgi:hypothetical protein
VDYRALVEQRLRNQIARHRAIAPRTSTEQIKSIQYVHEVEEIERIVDEPSVRTALKEAVKTWYDRL